jgi:dienelactone hydrolase
MRSKLIVAVAVGSCLAVNLVARAEDNSLRVLPETLNGAPAREMMARYLQRQAQQQFDRWQQQYEQLKTPEQIAAYQKKLREQFLAAIGGLPARTPLHPKVTGIVRRDGYRVEKVIFESQPKFYVTALLFLPEAGKFTPPFPGVIVPCGHAGEAKAYESYQTMGAFLALNGMAALVFDPIDQGERSQMPAALPNLWGTAAHTTLGVGSILLGRNTARFEIWDGMRAIDYLQSRPEIDPNRIGCTGNSGGGTQTSYLMALDDRIRAAAPSCYITGFRALLSTIGPQDAEQNIFGQVAFGMDHADYLMMRAPASILLCTATQDFFDIQGAWTSFRHAKRLYTRLGAPEQISLLENDAQHNYNRVQRQGVARWMARWLLRNDKPIVEPNIKLLTDAEARCTPDGQVMHLEGARSTYDLNRDFGKELAGRRKQLWKKTPRADLLEQVRRSAGVRHLAQLPEAGVEEHGTIARAGLSVQKMVVIPEEGIFLPALLFVPRENPSGSALLYLHENGKGPDAGPGGPIEKLVQAGRAVLAVDLRGTGETQSKAGWGGDLFGSDTKDVLTAYLLGRSYVGMRAEDILTCARFLQRKFKGPVDMVAVGHVCVPALHAAAFEPQLLGSVKLVRGLISWSNVVELGQSRNQLVNAVHGALFVYDLPDLARTLGDRLTVEEPLDALGEPVKMKDDPEEGAVLKKALRLDQDGENLLKADAWGGWQKGFEKSDGAFLCDNGTDNQAHRGVFQTVTLNQTKPEPIIATAWSRAEGVGGSRDRDYSLYLDLVYNDGTPLWGQVDSFNAGTHDWEKAQVIVFPEKPVARVSFYMLLRNHAGKAWFRDPELKTVSAFLFDGVPVQQVSPAPEGFQVRDVAAESDFVTIQQSTQDLKLDCRTEETAGATFFDVTLQDTSGRDRAVTLVYAVPLPAADWQWLEDPRHSAAAAEGREYVHAARFRVGANGRLSRYPFGAVASSDAGVALGIDIAQPAFFRVGYNAGTQELFLAYDLGLTPEKPAAALRFCKFTFDPQGEFRAALQRYYEGFPEAFHRRIAEQGLWMPFAKISAVPGWQDFGFRFKEGTDETKWDDEHGILTFRYTEPMTWWMRMPPGMPRTMEAALAEAQRLATEKKDAQAAALFTSGYHDENGRYCAQLLDTPWCNGAVWSMNSIPKIAGAITDFRNKWNPDLRARLYGPRRAADQDGEYIDSSEGYVTEELDFRRDHFSAAQTPLTFALDSRKPAIFRGLIVFEYIRAIGQDIHSLDKYMMANGTPDGLCWLAPLLDVLGTETDWNPGGNWQPMSDSNLLYRRALCRGKPYCFLMNTQFERFSHELVEKYMKRSLAYGMFPGFFSANASTGHYFARPELYERDRDLFKKYVPLCRQVAEAGWEPITLARADRKDVRVERFGDRYFTVLNDSGQPQEVTITTEVDVKGPARELLTGREIVWRDKKATLTLAAEDVAVLQLD